MTLTERFNEILIEHNITAYGLSRLTQLPTATIYQISTGKVVDPKLSTLITIADALDISLDEFRIDK